MNQSNEEDEVDDFFGTGTMYLILFSLSISKKYVFIDFGAIVLFYYEHRSIYIFFILQKRLPFSHKIIVFLVVGYLKKMNPESSDLSYVQINIQKLKSY